MQQKALRIQFSGVVMWFTSEEGRNKILLTLCLFPKYVYFEPESTLRVFPLSCIVGMIGYSVQSSVSNKYTPWWVRIGHKRNWMCAGNLESPEFLPKNIF